MQEPEAEAQSSAAATALSRREFAIMSAAAVVSPALASAAEQVVQRPVEIATADGTCDAVMVSPQGSAPWPAVILYPDAMGLRPVKVDMATRLAAEGYAVLVINPFYRVRKAPVFPATFSFASPDDRAQVMKMIAQLDHAVVTRDAIALMTFLDAQPEVDQTKPMGAVGFCMGGAMTIWAAAARPERVGAAVSFHGGRLVTDDPNSPHRLIARTKAAYHIGIAADDDAEEPDAKVALKEAFDAAGRPATMEVYPGTRHGWTVPDSSAHEPAQAARAWAAMVSTFKEALV